MNKTIYVPWWIWGVLLFIGWIGDFWPVIIVAMIGVYVFNQNVEKPDSDQNTNDEV